jgi:enoyl-CoA hydratase/carnithine racemase
VGFIADVGSSYFLNQCPGQIGLYLALTGTQIGAADAIFANLATHYVPSKKLPEFSVRKRIMRLKRTKKGEGRQLLSNIMSIFSFD